MDEALLRARRGRVVSAVAVLSLTSMTAGTAWGQTGPDLLLGSFEADENAMLNAEAFVQPKTETDNDEQDAQLFLFNASGRMKLDIDRWNSALNINRAQPRAGFDLTYINTNTDDPALPDQLSDTSFGFGMGIAAGQRYKAGISVAVGHASADPFSDGNGWYGKADLLFGYDFNERESLGVVLDYNGNRTFMPDVPLPGILYSRKIDDNRYTLTVGFPYSEIIWRPDDRWTLQLRYNIPQGGEVNVDYKVTETLHVYGAFTQQNEAFHWDELSDGDDRILFRQSRAELGLRGTYQNNVSFIVAGGYAFDQSFEVGWDSRDTDDLAELDSQPYLRIGFELSF